MKGVCLCGEVAFEIDKSYLKLYQCHCTLCRKQSGTYSNAASIVSDDSFKFTRGHDFIKSWVKDTGFRSDFCCQCGSPVPNPLRDTGYIWIPAGLLEGYEKMEIVSHIFLADKADWEASNLDAERHSQFPGFDEHIKTLNECHQ
ncbi:GFA family protein [Aliikangiella marina]|uniref:GFA family protein n=1 Tax=Aliikangiella marina TaxID=1712262 RepID=A0A545T1M2_9GAMM|nr:GFA family protein [Aliikangiella marina]TQV71095.1 GFA family protein [Aliikangiella marina]